MREAYRAETYVALAIVTSRSSDAAAKGDIPGCPKLNINVELMALYPARPITKPTPIAGVPNLSPTLKLLQKLLSLLIQHSLPLDTAGQDIDVQPKSIFVILASTSAAKDVRTHKRVSYNRQLPPRLGK
jgi:hypothetical protein